MTYGTLLLTERRGEGGILWVTLNRPEKLNAINMTLFDELRRLFQETRTDRSVRCVVITGAGRGFCAGADFSGGARPAGLLYPAQESATDLEGARMFFRNESEAYIALKRLDVPTLIIWGAQDHWVPVADAFRLQDDIKGAKLAIFEKAGHDPMEEDPRDTAAAVAAFLPTDPPAPLPHPPPAPPDSDQVVAPSVIPEKD